jgi:trimeric autotransporter adhesin
MKRFIILLILWPTLAGAQVFNLFQPAAGILKGQTTTYVTTAAAQSDGVSLFQPAADANSLGIGTSVLTQGGITGNHNTGIGQGLVFHLISSGSDNTALGYQALAAATTDIRNTAIGSGALQQSGGSQGNVAVGWLTLNNLIGNQNTAIGNGAGFVLTGANNTLAGWQAGVSLTSGNSNIIVGENGNITTGSSNILIGNSLASTVATTSNQLDIADVITATGINVPATSTTTIAGLGVVTGGLNSTSLGASTASTGAFTTLSSNGVTNLNASNNAATNIGTGTTTSTVTVGGGSNAVTLNATTLTLGGSTLVTSSSPVTLSNAAIRLTGLASQSTATTGTVCWTTGAVNLTVDTTLACLSSSKRFKEHIEPLDLGLGAVMKMTPVSYDLKPEFNHGGIGRQVGLIAEDVETIDPRLVGNDIEGKPLGVRYMQLTAVLIKAIQEQQAEIDELKRQNRALSSHRHSQ